MKKVLLEIMTIDGHIQGGIVEMVPASCTPLYLYCKLDEGVKRNCLVLDNNGDVKTSHIEYVKPYMIDTEEVPTQHDDTPKGEKFHRSAIITAGVSNIIPQKQHIYTKEELDSLDVEELEDVADEFGIDTLKLFDHELIKAILEKQKELSHEN